MTFEDNYAKYRGKCLEMSREAVAIDPTLRLARGHYICPFWGRQAHWWTVRPDGTIHDPSVLQFPSAGVGASYEEDVDDIHPCEHCGAMTHLEEAVMAEHHLFCSGTCYRRCVGL